MDRMAADRVGEPLASDQDVTHTSGGGMSFNPFQPDGLENLDNVMEISWEMFGELCRALAVRVVEDYEPEVIVGIARAGVIPGAVIASMLRVDFYSMKISRRDGAEVVRQRPAILSAAPQAVRGKRVLLVDEVATSGDTLRLGLAAIRDVGPSDVRTAVCFSRPRGFKPDYRALETDASLVYPWDRMVIRDGRLVSNPRFGLWDE